MLVAGDQRSLFAVGILGGHLLVITDHQIRSTQLLIRYCHGLEVDLVEVHAVVLWQPTGGLKIQPGQTASNVGIVHLTYANPRILLLMVVEILQRLPVSEQDDLMISVPEVIEAGQLTVQMAVANATDANHYLFFLSVGNTSTDSVGIMDW